MIPKRELIVKIEKRLPIILNLKIPFSITPPREITNVKVRSPR